MSGLLFEVERGWLETSDAVLMKDDLRHLAGLLQLSRETIKNIKQNLFWAFGYNF